MKQPICSTITQNNTSVTSKRDATFANNGHSQLMMPANGNFSNDKLTDIRKTENESKSFGMTMADKETKHADVSDFGSIRGSKELKTDYKKRFPNTNVNKIYVSKYMFRNRKIDKLRHTKHHNMKLFSAIKHSNIDSKEEYKSDKETKLSEFETMNNDIMNIYTQPNNDFHNNMTTTLHLKGSAETKDIISVYMMKSVIFNINGIPSFEYERSTLREATFAQYPNSAAKSPSVLVSSGFVYIGDGVNDKVRCYKCHVERQNWKTEEDVDEIHKRLSPHCPLANSVSSITASMNSANAFSESQSRDANQHLPVSNSRNESTMGTLNFAAENTESNCPDETANFQITRQNRAALATTHSSESINSNNIQQNINQSLSQTNARNDIHSVIQNLTLTTASEAVSAVPASLSRISAAEIPNTYPSEPVPAQSRVTYGDLGIVRAKPKHPNFASLSRRMESFVNFPQPHPVKPEDLAKAGMMYIGKDDCCRCFFCGGGLKQWEEGDNPYVEHARWFNKCPYIRQFMGQDFVDAVQELKPQGGTITLKNVEEHMRLHGKPIKAALQALSIMNDAAVQSLVEGKHNRDQVCRIATELYNSGVPLSADIILQRLYGHYSEPIGAASAQVDMSTGELQHLKEENYSMRKNMICKICLDKELEIVFLPCGHLVTCLECSLALKTCPICRTHISGTVKASFQ